MKSGNKKGNKNNGKGNSKGGLNNNTSTVPSVIHSIHKEEERKDDDIKPFLELLSKSDHSTTDPTTTTTSNLLKEQQLALAEDSKEEMVAEVQEEEEISKELFLPPIINFSTIITTEEEGEGEEMALDGSSSWRDVDSPLKKGIEKDFQVEKEKDEKLHSLVGENTSHKTASTCMSDLTNIPSDKNIVQSAAQNPSLFQSIMSVILSLLGPIVVLVIDTVRTIMSFYQQLISQSLTTLQGWMEAAVSWYLCTLLWLITLPYFLAVEALTFALRAVVTAVVYFLNHTPGGSKIPTVGEINTSASSAVPLSGALAQ
jgi:hypothetical protein